MKSARKRRGITQEQLAERLRALGFSADRTAVLKIEKGTRGIAVGEAFALAAALDVLPVHLFAPLEDDAVVSVTTEHELPVEHLRGWIRGDLFLPGSSTRAVASEMPESELRQMFLGQLTSVSGLTDEERTTLTKRRKDVLARVEKQLDYSLGEAIRDAIEQATRPSSKRRRRKEDDNG